MKQFNGNDYDTLFPETLGEQVIPSSSVLSLFNLPQNSKVDDVLAWLGRFNEHWWKRRTATRNEVETKTGITETIALNTTNLRYSTSIVISDDNVVSLKNPQDAGIASTATGAQQLADLAPCYIRQASQEVYFLPEGSSGGTGTTATVRYSSGIKLNSSATVKAQLVTGKVTYSYGEWELLLSTNRNAYPDSGVQDGYEYEYLGVPFDKLPTAPQIETGSYVGTGTAGKSNPTSLTFEFVPKLVFIYVDRITPHDGYMSDSAIWGQGVNLFRATSASSGDSTVTTIGRTLMWYLKTPQGDPRDQLNRLSTVYNYVAIG